MQRSWSEKDISDSEALLLTADPIDDASNEEE
jgi:hypothetical protein